MAVLITAVAAYLLNFRLFRTTETALAALRVRAFRRVHDLSMLHQQAERRGSLVSRVTSDVDQMSVFMQWGGILAGQPSGQLLLATVLMAIYSWQLTLLVCACFLPLAIALPRLAARLAAAYGTSGSGSATCSARCPSRWSAPRPCGRTRSRTGPRHRIDGAIDRHYRARGRAQKTTVRCSPPASWSRRWPTRPSSWSACCSASAGGLTAGKLVAFLFLVTLFIAPVQVGQRGAERGAERAGLLPPRARRGRRRARRRRPRAAAAPGTRCRPARSASASSSVTFRYPPATRAALVDVDLEVAPRSRVAVVGETGSGKTTFAKLLTRLMDPAEGRVLLGRRAVPLDDVPSARCASRVVMVPQDGFLFDASVADNVRYGRPGATDDEVTAAFGALGLGDWLAGLPRRRATPVGQRGESLSVGERQLVAIARAYVADPDLLVLDEATSAVDPATEVRLTRALDSLTRGRTTLIIAHRLSTAESADEILVVDAGRVVQRGPHAELVTPTGPYARLHASWRRSSAGEPEPEPVA